MGKRLRQWAILPLFLGIVTCWGCASLNQTERIAGVPIPAERMAQIRTLGENAKDVPAAERERYATTLAEVIGDESDALIRREAVLAIAHYPCDTAKKALLQASADSDRDVREASVTAWRNYGGDEGVDALIQMLSKESDLDIRIETIDALGSLKNPKAVAALEAPLSENDPALQHYSVLALQKITGSKATSPEAWLVYCRERGELPQPEKNVLGFSKP